MDKRLENVDLKAVAERLSAEMKWSPSAGRAAVREAAKGVAENPKKPIEEAAYIALKSYY
jgi:hypothetical protein